MTTVHYDKVVPQKAVKTVSEQHSTICTQKTLTFHVNTRPNKFKVTVTFLVKQEMTVLDHIPYSPKHIPCNFWLFHLLKQQLARRKLNMIKDLKKL